MCRREKNSIKLQHRSVFPIAGALFAVSLFSAQLASLSTVQFTQSTKFTNGCLNARLTGYFQHRLCSQNTKPCRPNNAASRLFRSSCFNAGETLVPARYQNYFLVCCKFSSNYAFVQPNPSLKIPIFPSTKPCRYYLHHNDE